jgi:UDP-glucose 4-epimerase
VKGSIPAQKLLVTGGAGFIGSNLVAHINRSSPTWGVRVIDDLSSGNLANLGENSYELFRGSILDPETLTKAVDGVDTIVHLAAIGSVPRSVSQPRATNAANITGTLNVLEAARQAKVGHVIVASSSSVYGSNPALPRGELDWTRPMSPYGVSKLATEAYAIAYGTTYGLSTLAFRFFNVYGPGQSAGHPYAAVVPRFISAALQGSSLEIHGDGTQSRDFTYVKDVCEVIHRACEERISYPQPVNLAFGTKTTIRQLIIIIEEILGVSVATEFTASRLGDVNASQADTALVTELFPEVRPVALIEGITSTLEWFRSGKK